MHNNRAQGHNYEREKRLEFREIGFENCETCRYSSREKDDNKIDLDYTDPFDVQLKYKKKTPSWTELLYEQMPQDNNNWNLLIFKRNTGRGPKKREYAAMKYEGWQELYEIYQEEMPGFPAEFNEIYYDKGRVRLLDKKVYKQGNPKLFPNVVRYDIEDKKLDMALTKWKEMKILIKKIKRENII